MPREWNVAGLTSESDKRTQPSATKEFPDSGKSEYCASEM